MRNNVSEPEYKKGLAPQEVGEGLEIEKEKEEKEKVFPEEKSSQVEPSVLPEDRIEREDKSKEEVQEEVSKKEVLGDINLQSIKSIIEKPELLKEVINKEKNNPDELTNIRNELREESQKNQEGQEDNLPKAT